MAGQVLKAPEGSSEHMTDRFPLRTPSRGPIGTGTADVGQRVSGAGRSPRDSLWPGFGLGEWCYDGALRLCAWTGHGNRPSFPPEPSRSATIGAGMPAPMSRLPSTPKGRPSGLRVRYPRRLGLAVFQACPTGSGVGTTVALSERQHPPHPAGDRWH